MAVQLTHLFPYGRTNVQLSVFEDQMVLTLKQKNNQRTIKPVTHIPHTSTRTYKTYTDRHRQKYICTHYAAKCYTDSYSQRHTLSLRG